MRVLKGRRLGAIAIVTLLALLGAACGGDDDDDAGDDGTEDEAFDENGVITIGTDLSLATRAWDPVKSFSQFDHLRLVYDTWLRNNPDGTFREGLAKEWKVVDPQTIDITMQDGITFSDGTPFTAQVAREGLLRNAAATANGFRVEVKELQDVIVKDATHFTIKLKTPVAGNWLGLLNSGETMVPSPKAVAAGQDLSTKPVGAGPYTLESYQDKVSATLKKNPTYWEADSIKLAGIDMIHVQDSVAAENGMRSGQIDMIPQAANSSYQTLSAQNDFEAISDPSGNVWNQIFLCKSRPPFDNLKTRQALNYAIDDDQISEVLYGKAAEKVYGSWPEASPFFNEDLKGTYDYDPDEAKKLLSEAGYTSSNPLVFTAYYSQGGDSLRVMEIAQQQLKAIGVTMNLQVVTNLFQEFLIEARNPAGIITMQRQGTGKITRIYGTTSPVNLCKYSDPELDKLMADLGAVDQATPSDEAVELWHEAQKIVLDDALGVFMFFVPDNAVWRNNIGGVEMVPNYSTGSLIPDYFKLYVKA
jgi:peptide/nickel transport system substrate-binding protein